MPPPAPRESCWPCGWSPYPPAPVCFLFHQPTLPIFFSPAPHCTTLPHTSSHNTPIIPTTPRCPAHRDVAALGATCRALRSACSDGEVWRAQLQRSFPGSSLACAELADYHIAFQLEANGVVPELSCFYSRAPFDVEVLGYPFQASWAGVVAG